MRPFALALLVAGLAAGCSKTALSSDVPSGAAGASRPRLAESSKAVRTPDARAKTWPTRSADTSWIRRLPRAKEFVVRGELKPAMSLSFSWRIHPSLRRPGTEGEGEYASLYDAKVELVVTGDGGASSLELGRHAGNVEGGRITFCERAGFRQPANGGWLSPAIPNRVAFFELDTPQGGSEWLVVLGAERLHLLHRLTDDGACPVMLRQGPLEVCRDNAWEQYAEFEVTGEPRVSERVVHVDEEGRSEPLDCKASYSGESLLAPGE